MTDFNEKLSELNRRLEKMVEYQEYFYREINLIRQEINFLKLKTSALDAESENNERYQPPFRENNRQSSYSPPAAEQTFASDENHAPKSPETPPQTSQNFNFGLFGMAQKSGEKSNVEKFIGENLISLIGIAITILGVGIGAKYAIDHELISPSARIILGYLFGFGLLAFAVRLKTKYHNFSAVLLSGALATMYFITFAAHAYYDLIPQFLAFALMFFLTDVTVLAALRYNRQVIAHFGLVGAYAIPFLLGGDAGNIGVLFAYIAIINAGILALSVRKYWKSLFYSSFIFTWATFTVWFSSGYKSAEHSILALAFATIFFLIFYATFLAYKLINKEEFSVENVVLLLLNSFIFYGFGYAILERNASGAQVLGLFTLANAAIHFAVAFAIKKFELADRQLLQLLAGLGLIFVTIAVPVQLDGNWVTLFWAAEAALLFWLGRTRGARIYEFLSFPPMILALLSLLHDWMVLSDRQNRLEPEAALVPFLNVYFVTAIFVAAAFALIERTNAATRFKPAIDESLRKITTIVFPVVFLVVLYNAVRLEINNFWYWQIIKTAIPLPRDVVSASGDFYIDKDLNLFNIIFQIDYTMLFVAALAFVNSKILKNYRLALVNFGLAAVALFVFLTIGLFALGELRESYLLRVENAETFTRGVYHILIRYVSYVFVAGLFLACYDLRVQKFAVEKLPKKESEATFDVVFYGSLWWLASSELLNWLDVLKVSQSDKLGLSILWGVYALVLIVLGIAQSKKHLRFSAIALSALTLVKFFFYDIAHLDTISKTIVFVSLGISLLLISFLYNKYKHIIFEQSEA